MSLYVAVVSKDVDDFHSNRPDGDYSCFIDETRDGAISRALEAKRKWGSKYRVLVGTLTAEAKVTANYTLKEI